MVKGGELRKFAQNGIFAQKKRSVPKNHFDTLHKMMRQ